MNTNTEAGTDADWLSDNEAWCTYYRSYVRFREEVPSSWDTEIDTDYLAPYDSEVAGAYFYVSWTKWEVKLDDGAVWSGVEYHNH